MTSLDVTKVYGMETLPSLDKIPSYTVNFAQDYKINDLSVESIDSFYSKSDLNTLLKLVSDKTGFPSSNPASFKEGLDLAASWSLISPTHDNANYFICQNTRGRTKDKI